MVFGNFKKSIVDLTSCKSWLLLFLVLVSNAVHAQNLEETIYRSLESFVANPSEVELQELQIEKNSFSNQVSSPDEHLALLSLQCNLGYYSDQYGKTLEAIENYESGWKNYETNQLDTYDISEYCLKPLGNLYTKTGAFTNAENTIKQYILYAEQQNNLAQKVGGILNLSVVYNNTGNQKTAITLIRNTLRTPGLSSYHKAALENNLATNLFAIGDYEEAQKLIQNVISSGRNISVNVYKNAAQLALKNNEYKESEKYFQLAEKSLIQSENFSARDLAKLHEEKSQLYFIQNKNEEAKASLITSLRMLLPYLEEGQMPLKIDLYPENTFSSIFDGFALLQTNAQDALQFYELSIYASNLLAGNLNSQEAKILHQLDNRKRSEKCIALLFEEFQKTGDLTQLSRAYSFAESSKAFVLTEMQSRQSLLDANPNDLELLKERSLLRKQESLINELVRAQLSLQNEVNLNKITEELNSLNLELKAVKKQLSKKYPSLIATSANLEILQSKLKSDNALMSYFFYGNKSLYHFKISGNEIQLTEKPISKAFTKSLSSFIQFFDDASLINNNISNFTATSSALFNELELSKSSNYKNLVIISDGLLNFVPFEALLIEETTALQFSEMPFLIKHFRIGYNTNASFYTRTSLDESKNKLLGVFPVFEGTKKELQYSINEAENIRDEISSTILFKEAATKENFLAKARNYNILHLSTHASGGDFVIPANIEFVDDVMLLHELYSLELSPKLVVLSACETGIGKLQKGEGAMSVARGFQYAGAKNLLFSLWKVNDLSTSRIMSSFYKSFGKTASAFNANHHSKLNYLKNGNISNSKKSPYYWSSFVYYGELSEEKIGYRNYLIFLLIALLIVSIWFFRKKIKL